MTESEAKQSVVALVQLMGWTIDWAGHLGMSGIQFKIKLRSPKEVIMKDDWVKDVSNITDGGYRIFCFHTWVSALNALCSYDRNEQLAHRP